VEYNPGNGNNTKLIAVTIGGEPLNNDTTYQVVTLDFIAGGGDNFFEPTSDFITLDTQDEVLTAYILSQTPVNIELDGRIEEVDRQREGIPGAGNGTSTGNGTTNGTSPTTGVPPEQTTNAAASLGAGAVGVSIFAVLAGLLML
jgi:hypothetical protein